jgi:hypothetical protein
MYGTYGRQMEKAENQKSWKCDGSRLRRQENRWEREHRKQKNRKKVRWC